MMEKAFYVPLRFLGYVFEKHADWWSRNKKDKYPGKSLMERALQLFYLDYLRVSKEKCEVVELSDERLVTKCTNFCPVYFLTQFFHLETRYVCGIVSEPASKKFIKNLGLEFTRDYNHIRPYTNSCKEVIQKA